MIVLNKCQELITRTIDEIVTHVFVTVLVLLKYTQSARFGDGQSVS